MMWLHTEVETFSVHRPGSLTRFALCVVAGLNVASVVATLLTA
jgi:hypothetical protein